MASFWCEHVKLNMKMQSWITSIPFLTYLTYVTLLLCVNSFMCMQGSNLIKPFLHTLHFYGFVLYEFFDEHANLNYEKTFCDIHHSRMAFFFVWIPRRACKVAPRVNLFDISHTHKVASFLGIPLRACTFETLLNLLLHASDSYVYSIVWICRCAANLKPE